MQNYRDDNEVLLADAFSHSSPDYHCTLMSSCTFTEQTLLTRVRVGEEKEHMRWDRREQIRADLKELVTRLVGEVYAEDKVFMNSLLCNN